MLQMCWAVVCRELHYGDGLLYKYFDTKMITISQLILIHLRLIYSVLFVINRSRKQ